MEDRCISCGADVSDQSRWHCLNCETDMNTTKQTIYKTKLKKYIRWINQKPPKWKFISYIKWLNGRPPSP